MYTLNILCLSTYNTRATLKVNICIGFFVFYCSCHASSSFPQSLLEFVQHGMVEVYSVHCYRRFYIYLWDIIK